MYASSSAYGNAGCNGGNGEDALHYAHDVLAAGGGTSETLKKYGVETESNYPYQARVGGGFFCKKKNLI